MTYFSNLVFHLRDLANGRRRRIKAAEVKTINVPHFEGLSTETMLYHARNWPDVARALPSEQREVEKLPRQYIANVIYTVVGPVFKQWVEGEINKRNAKIIEDQNLAIDMDPEIYEAFMASKHIST